MRAHFSFYTFTILAKKIPVIKPKNIVRADKKTLLETIREDTKS